MVELEFPRRGLHRIAAAHLATLFPLGLFRKGMRQRLDREVLVFPQLFPGPALGAAVDLGHRRDPGPRAGWGHDLHSLRVLRPGDDPRRIHWKQTARTGSLIFMEREAERSRRISVVLDNAVDPAHGKAGEERLELRISEAAAAALDYLQAGFEVELVTRTERVEFGAGPRQRRRILETLAAARVGGGVRRAAHRRRRSLEVRFETSGMGAA